MPNTKTAKKALRQNVRHRKMNLDRQKKMKTVIKDFKKTDSKKEDISKVYKTLDKLAKLGFIKKNKANRLKSRLARKK